MSSQDNARKNRGGRPVTTGKGQLIGVRLLPDLLSALDEYRATFSPVINRAAAIRTIVAEKLQRKARR
jgi:hypothetical protein